MSYRVLIVENEAQTAELQKDYLEMNDFEVCWESDGKSGLKRALAEPFDLIILEIDLPGMDGFEICKKVKEIKTLPILVISGRREEIDIIRALGIGANDYMCKPFSPAEMIARVKAHIGVYESLLSINKKNNEIIDIGGIRIDKTARRVFVNDVEKNFTTKEYDLLVYLAQHPNHVFKKEELFREIWDMESVGDIATVTVHVKKIREKIETDSSRPKYIETIWGVGYRFKV